MSCNDSSDLLSRLSGWLEEQGYPLEMVVARTFREADFRTLQSSYYTDPESDVQREIDVIAYRQNQIGKILVRVSFAIECKLSRDKPWVLFTSEDVRLAGPARVVQRASSGLGHKFLSSIARDEDIQTLNMLSLPRRPGYGVTQAFTSGQDTPYTACMGVAKCAVAEVLAADKASRTQGPLLKIVFPVVVMDGKLFECYLTEDGAITVLEIERGILVWRNPIVRVPHTIIDIVTVTGLPSLVRDANEAAVRLLACKEAVNELYESEAVPSFDPTSGYTVGRRQ
jgi:hypothetical protein